MPCLKTKKSNRCNVYILDCSMEWCQLTTCSLFLIPAVVDWVQVYYSHCGVPGVKWSNQPVLFFMCHIFCCQLVDLVSHLSTMGDLHSDRQSVDRFRQNQLSGLQRPMKLHIFWKIACVWSRTHARTNTHMHTHTQVQPYVFFQPVSAACIPSCRRSSSQELMAVALIKITYFQSVGKSNASLWGIFIPSRTEPANTKCAFKQPYTFGCC